MPKARADNFAMLGHSDGSVLCCGGAVNGVKNLKQCYKYSGAEWIDVGDVLIHERRHSKAVKLSDGRFWIFGGTGYELLNVCDVLQLPRAKQGAPTQVHF